VGTRAHLGTTQESLWGQTHDGTDEGVGQATQQRFRHDLRQPLTTASLLLEHVAGTPALEPATLARIRESQRQVSWALELLRAQETTEQIVDVMEIGDTVADVVPLATGWCDISLIRPNRAYVLVERLELLRATRNLLDNAVHAATSVDGFATVQVTVDRRRDEALLAVDDNGPGFGRVAPRNGLGLLSVERFAEQWGGSLSVGMSPLGGACVELRLPITSRPLAG
jgi:signal transduction histidine kinase